MVSEPTPDGTPPTWDTYQPPGGTAAPNSERGRPRRLVAGITAVAVAGVGVATLGQAIFGGVHPLERAGFEELLADLERERGSTEVFEVTLYEDNAWLDAPVDDSSQRYEDLVWDGGFDERSTSTTGAERFDLADVDPDVLPGLCDRASDLVDDPTMCYILIAAPDPLEDGDWLRAHASNEYGEDGSVTAGLDGEVIEERGP